MTTKRAAGFDLRAALDDGGFTPRATDAGALLEILAEGGEPGAAATRALLRLGVPARVAAVQRCATEGRSPDLLWLIGRLEPDAAAIDALTAALDDEDPRTRRAAAVALGKAAAPGSDAPLASALAREGNASARRAIVVALGKVGGDAARAALVALDAAIAGPDASIDRERSRAALMLERADARGSGGTLDLTVPVAAPMVVALRCRAGIEPLLLEELASADAVASSRGLLGDHVETIVRSAPADLFAARTWISFGFPLRPVPATPEDPARAIVSSITSPEALAILRRFTSGPLRYRLSFAGGGKRRSVVWRVAVEAQAQVADLVNDPTASAWEAVVHEGRAHVQVELVPRSVDARFAYRVGDVPAASHPTIAAALIRAAGPNPAEVAWDPFTGSGTELCERAIAGSYRSLVGSDHDARVLEVARANLEACGARGVTLLEGDATRLVPPGAPPTLIVTNPPLGRRVQRSAALGPLLDRFLAHAARVLAPGGRVAWISPFPERTRDAAARAGLGVARALDVDMGGFTAELQVLQR